MDFLVEEVVASNRPLCVQCIVCRDCVRLDVVVGLDARRGRERHLISEGLILPAHRR